MYFLSSTYFDQVLMAEERGDMNNYANIRMN